MYIILIIYDLYKSVNDAKTPQGITLCGTVYSFSDILEMKCN